MPMNEKQAQRNRDLQNARDERRRERQRITRAAEARARRTASRQEAEAAAAIALYRREKARAEQRTAKQKAEVLDAVKRALAKADADRNPRNRAGRPKKKPMPALHLKSDPANALINALEPWGFQV